MKESRSPTFQEKFPDYLDLGTDLVFLGAVFRAVTFFLAAGFFGWDRRLVGSFVLFQKHFARNKNNLHYIKFRLKLQ